MIASGDVELEGVTTFAKDSSTNYRYTVALKDNKLNFSLEDCSTKKQWYDHVKSVGFSPQLTNVVH